MVFLRAVAAMLSLAFLVLSQPGHTQVTPDSTSVYIPDIGLNQYITGPYVPKIKDAPFTARFVFTEVKTLADGTLMSRKTTTLVARDSAGRTRNESRKLVSAADSAEPPVVDYSIFDQDSWTRTDIFPRSREAFVRHLLGPKKTMPVVDPSRPEHTAANVAEEILGSETFSGIEIRGTRKTRSYAAELVGTDHPLQVIDEYWFSPTLQINLKSRHSDPRLGVQTMNVVELVLGEPDPKLLEIPAGYRISETRETTELKSSVNRVPR